MYIKTELRDKDTLHNDITSPPLACLAKQTFFIFYSEVQNQG